MAKAKRKSKIMDFLVNYTVGKRLSWSKDFDWRFPYTPLVDFILLAQSDGGTRAHGCSAAAWVVEVRRSNAESIEWDVIAMSGTYIELPRSSFTAEAPALAECTLFLRRMHQRCDITGTHGKRQQ